MRLSVVIDSPPSRANHAVTVAALQHALAHAGADGVVHAVRTREVDDGFLANPGDGILIGPGSPYEHPAAAEAAIQTAREQGIPLVGT